jgi:hypothetical protein
MVIDHDERRRLVADSHNEEAPLLSEEEEEEDEEDRPKHAAKQVAKKPTLIGEHLTGEQRIARTNHLKQHPNLGVNSPTYNNANQPASPTDEDQEAEMQLPPRHKIFSGSSDEWTDERIRDYQMHID